MALQVDPSSRKEDLLDAALGERIYAASKPKMTLGMGKRGKASKPLQVSAVQTPQSAQPLTMRAYRVVNCVSDASVFLPNEKPISFQHRYEETRTKQSYSLACVY